MPTVKLIMEYDNGEVYESETHEVEGLGVLLVDTPNDTIPDVVRDMGGTNLENLSALHPDEAPSFSDIDLMER